MTHPMLRPLAWGLMTITATTIALFSLRYLLTDPPAIDPEIAINFVANRTVFLTHVRASLIALLLGPWQFVSKLRSKDPRIHRWIGRVYCIMVLVGGVGGFIVAWTTTAGIIASFGFASLAGVWLYTTGRAYRLARLRDFTAHRRWMIRSYAVAGAAITLRLDLPIAPLLGYSSLSGYIFFACWASWIINLAVAEAYLRADGPRQRRQRTVTSPS